MNALCNESPAARNETCLLCGAPLKRPRTGRPPRFCSPAHRVRHHRMVRAIPTSEPSLPAVTAPPPLPVRPPRPAALTELHDRLDSLRAPKGAARLRDIAEDAVELGELLEEIRDLAWSLKEFDGDAACTFEDLLGDHNRTLDQLAVLDDLASDLDRLARDVRAALRERDAVGYALDEIEEAIAEGNFEADLAREELDAADV